MNAQEIISAMPLLKEYKTKDSILSFICPMANLRDYALKLKNELNFETLSDLASIDNGVDAKERFSVAYVFISHSKKIYLKFKISGGENFPTISDIYKSANWQEREAFDMMGIIFTGHADLRRILMWDSYSWHPLQKDFPLCGKEAPLPESFEGNETITSVEPAMSVGGPFYSKCGENFTADREPRSREK